MGLSAVSLAGALRPGHSHEGSLKRMEVVSILDGRRPEDSIDAPACFLRVSKEVKIESQLPPVIRIENMSKTLCASNTLREHEFTSETLQWLHLPFTIYFLRIPYIL